MSNTPIKTFRCDAELWGKVKVKAKEEGETATDVIIRALVDYVSDEDES